MLCMIPIAFGKHRRYFLTAYVQYDVIATSGPPGPPFDVRLRAVIVTGGCIMTTHLWGEEAELLDLDDKPFTGVDVVGFANEYVQAHKERVLSLCRENEFDNGENVWYD